MKTKLLPLVLFVSAIIIFTNCASSEHTETFTPSTDFNAGSYINPQDYGYSLDISEQKTSGSLPDSSFIPASIKGGFNNAVKEHLDIPKKVYRNRLKGEVILDVYIDSSSTLQYVKEIQSPAQTLTNATTQILIKSDFNAAALNNKPVNSLVRVTLNYGMEIKTK